MAKILAAVSGGVDSSVAAALLLEQGHEVVGAYMKNWINEEGLPGDCPWQQDIIDARAVCDHLGIELRVLSLMDAYRERVVEYLLAGYRDGVTPNPDVMCNREMKFGVFREYARAQGFDALATGHYARLAPDGFGEGGVSLLRGADGNKDQSYFLALLEQVQLRDAMFPIGEIAKPEVRREAERLGIPVAKKKDSQGICFMGDIKMADFLGHYLDDEPGEIVTLDGKVVGEHRGLHFYTLGQRRGVGVASAEFGKAYVVVAKQAEENRLLVAFDEPQTPGLYSTGCRVVSLSVANPARPLQEVENLRAQPRYRCPAAAVTGTFNEEANSVDLAFAEPQRALTPGQICAFYEGEALVGGGIFETVW